MELLRRTLRRLGLTRDPAEVGARKAVRAAFADQVPDEQIDQLRLRAAEPDRFVFAVIIRSKLYRGLPPYRLFAVTRDLLSVDELPKGSDSPYIFRGIK